MESDRLIEDNQCKSRNYKLNSTVIHILVSEKLLFSLHLQYAGISTSESVYIAHSAAVTIIVDDTLQRNLLLSDYLIFFLIYITISIYEINDCQHFPTIPVAL